MSIIIIKVGHPRADDMDYHGSENVVLQADEHGAVNIEDEVNDPMEEDDHALENIIEDDGTNTLIHDTFSGKADHDDRDDFDDVHDLPILEKAYEPLYEGSQTTLLFVVFLLLNLKVMNGLSNIAISQMIRYVIYVIFFYLF